MTYNTEAIVIKKRPWREDDVLYTFFTRERGKVEAVAKGAKKIKSKMAAHLEPFSLTRVMIAKSKTIDKVAGGNLSKDFLNIKSSFAKIILVSYVWEILDQLVDVENKDDRIFRLMRRYLEVLDNDFNIKQGQFFSKIFILQLFDFLGYTPELYSCVHCKNDLEGKEDYFCAKHGGLICHSCPKEEHFIKMDLTSIKYLRLMMISDLGEFSRVKLPDNVYADIGRAIEEFMKYRLERNLKSEKYFLRLFKSMNIIHT